MTISQTLERDLCTERACGNNVVKAIVYVAYCKEIQRKGKKKESACPWGKAAGKWEQYETRVSWD